MTLRCAFAAKIDIGSSSPKRPSAKRRGRGAIVVEIVVVVIVLLHGKRSHGLW